MRAYELAGTALFGGAIILLALASGSAPVIDMVIRLSIFGLFALSLNILVGTTGLVSFGHAMFFGLGAYAFGLLMQSGAVSIPLAALLALAITAAWGLVVGALCIRLTDIYFSFLTLAFQMLLYSVILSWVSLTGGDQGLLGGIPRPPFLGIDLADQRQFFIATVVVCLLSGLAIRQIVQSPFGYALRMIRDNAERARFLGLPVQRYKLAAFIVSGLFAAIAGILMSLYVSGAYPNFAFWTVSGEAIFMIMLGGITIFVGPVVGTALFLLLNDLITRTTEYHGLAMGTILLVLVLGLRQGVLELAVDRWALWRGRAARGTPEQRTTT